MSSRRTGSRQRAEVVKAVFISAGRHHPQFMRPFEVNATDESINEMLNNLGNADFETDSLGGWSAGLIGCSAQVDENDEALIPHGWDADRLRFFIHAQISDRMTNDTLDFYVTGFTENDTLYELEGGSLQMEDDTRLFINSIMRIRRQSGRDMSDLLGGSNDDRLYIEANSHCLTAHTENDLLRRDHKDIRSLRPYDVVSKIDADGEQYLMDSRSDFRTSSVKPSSRMNSTANSYIGRTIKAMTDSEREANTDSDWRPTGTKKNPYTDASRTLTERDQSKCKFRRMLGSETAYNRTGYITWDEAVALLDGIDDDRFTQLFRDEGATKGRRSGRTSDLSGEGHGGSDLETVASYQALNSISSIMMESCIMQAHILASTNRRGEIQFSFQRGTAPTFFIDSMSEEQQEDTLFLFERRLRQFVFDPMEYKVDEFALDASMDALGDSQFFLSIQGNKEAEFWSATFADGSSSSLLTTRPGASADLARDAKRLVDSLVA